MASVYISWYRYCLRYHDEDLPLVTLLYVYVPYYFHPGDVLVSVLSCPVLPHPPCPCIHPRIFSHPNVLPVLGACQSPPAPHPVIITHWMPYGSLYNVLHEGTSEYCVGVTSVLQLLVKTHKYLHGDLPMCKLCLRCMSFLLPCEIMWNGQCTVRALEAISSIRLYFDAQFEAGKVFVKICCFFFVTVCTCIRT